MFIRYKAAICGLACALALGTGAGSMVSYAHSGHHEGRYSQSATVSCPDCRDGKVDCAYCDGTGKTHDGYECDHCGHTGRTDCQTCGGNGSCASGNSGSHHGKSHHSARSCR